MSKLTQSSGFATIKQWLADKGQAPFDFQRQTWEKYSRGYSGLVIAPTGFGKTFSVFLAVVIDSLNHPHKYGKGLKLLWVTPLRSLAADLQLAMQTALDELGIDWQVQVRNGDTPQADRQRQMRNMPDILIITPESLHLLIAHKKSTTLFNHLHAVAVDEWHELLGSKRGVLTELALSYLRSVRPNLSTWGISATLGNIEEAQAVLIPSADKQTIVRAKLSKALRIETVLPNDINEMPWAGHLGSNMAKKIIPIILSSNTTLIFTNTRKQAEHWYQLLLQAEPDLAGQVAIHHGSIDKELRQWIETNLNQNKLKAVVCTSSLDLGVDFQPVDSVIQIGSTKSLGRLIQRAGRSGHRPEAESVIHLVPTHSLEIIDMLALKNAFKQNAIESRRPARLPLDVLVQYLVTRALGSGFHAPALLAEIKQTYTYRSLSEDQWQWALQFITQGGPSLQAYEQYHKVVQDDAGCYRVTNRRIAMIHRVNIGVIVSDSMMQVKFARGGLVGMVEESFISRLKNGDKFVLAGRVLELLRSKEMTAYVKLAQGKAKSPSWLGGRLPLSSEMSHLMREQLDVTRQLLEGKFSGKQRAAAPELRKIAPLMALQASRSIIPNKDELLIEQIKTRDGYHLFVYPFEGRAVHEALSALLAYRLSLLAPLSVTIACNDYGFELLSATPFALNDDNVHSLFSAEHLIEDIKQSLNATEMAMRQFRSIAVIAGLVAQNYPGQQKTFRNLQASAGIIFNVLADYEPDHPLLEQAFAEVFDQEIDFARLEDSLQRITQMSIRIINTSQFTPLSFPIKVDSLRMSLSNEDLATRIERLQRAAWQDQPKKS